MNADDNKRIKDLLDQACDLPPEARCDFLSKACHNDPALLAEALDLVAYDHPNAPNLHVDIPTILNMVGESIGPYTILKEIGEGGMGIVYLAEQTEPITRRVALKIIKFGMDTREVIARFESERQALALMDHPNIARVLDAGATEDGRPYFVMEHIDGVPVTEFCDHRDLGLRERLDIFVQVCRGINHAHQKGVIHRDIKPSNVLVTDIEGRAVPKVIDFGVAKAIGTEPAAMTALTQMGRLIGTIEYMSPEQADPAAPDVDTRSDVYALGVLLYELMTGVPPVEKAELMQAGLDGIRAHLERFDPPKPSTRLGTLGTEIHHGTDTRIWRKRISGDLDWITMKALEKECDHRYASPAALADDIERHLRHDPVEAGPPGSLYRLKKFVRRHRAGVSAGLLILVALVVGTIGTTIGMIRAERAEQVARAAADRAEAGLLYQTARADNVPWKRLAYAAEALEYRDRPEYRRLLQQTLESGPTLFALEPAQDSHNPWMAEFSPDGRWLAVAWSKGGTVQLHDTDDGEIRLLKGHTQAVYDACFSPDSNWLATAGTDSTVRIWSPSDTEPVRLWRFDGLACPFWAPDGDRLVVGIVAQGQPLSWRVLPLDGSEPVELGASGPPNTDLMLTPYMDLDPNGNRLALPVADRIELYDMNDLARGPIQVIGRHDVKVAGVVFSPDGDHVLSDDVEGRARLWKLSEPGRGLVREFPAFADIINTHFDATGRRISLGGSTGLQIWDLDLPTAAAPRLLESGHWIFNGAFSPDGDWVVTTGVDRHVGAWSLHRTLPIDLMLEDGSSAVVAFSPDGRWLVSADEQGHIQGWPLDGLRIGDPIPLHHAPNTHYSWLCFDDASRYVFAAVCNSPEGQGTLTRIALDGSGTTLWDGVTCHICVDATGRYVASNADHALGHRYVRILDTETGTTLDLDAPDGGAEFAAGFVRDGRVLAFGAAGLALWDVTDGAYERIADLPIWAILAADRETVIIQDGRPRLTYRRRIGETERERLDLNFSQRAINIVVADTLATHVVAGLIGGEVELLDTKSGRHYNLPVFDAINAYVALDPHGRWIATSRDGVVKLIPLPIDPPRHDLPLTELLAQVSAMSNMRVIHDETGPGGYGWDMGPPPNWSQPPGH